MRSPDFLTLRRLRRALFEFRLALAIGAAAAERRTLGEDLAVVLVVAARPIVGSRFAARMLLPVGAAFGPLGADDRISDDPRGTILARTRKPRTLIAAAVVARLVEARLVEIPRAIAGGTGIALAAILALLPRLGIAAIGAIAKILARAAIRRTAREFLVAAEFSLGPIATRRSPSRGGRALKGRSPRGRSPSLRKPSPRGVYGRLSPNFLSAKRDAGRASLVAIPARRAIVAIEVRAIAARRERTLLAISILARAKILPLTAIRPIAARAVDRRVETGDCREARRIAEIPARRTITVAHRACRR